MKARKAWALWLILATCGSAAVAQAIDYDIVYVRAPRFGDAQNSLWPEVFHPARLDAGADLMLLHPDGSEETLVDCGACSVTDPVLSFDAQWVFYALYPDPADNNGQRANLPYGGADIYRIHLPSRRIERLTGQDFTPNTGAGVWKKKPGSEAYDPLTTEEAYTSLRYGILNLGPCPLPGGRLMFSSNRNGFTPPKDYTAPTLQLFVMDEDGRNLELVGPMNLGSALHPTVLADGRVMFSSYESQGLRDNRLWGLWSIWPDGRVFEPLLSAFSSTQAFHFQTQLSDESIVVVDYYNLNNNGFGTLYKFPAHAMAGSPAFGSWKPELNPPLKQGLYPDGLARNLYYAFSPSGITALTPFTTGQDEAAPLYQYNGPEDGPRMGKFTHPSAAPGNDLLVVWTPGPANDLDRPSPLPYYDGGVYLLRDGAPIQSPDDLVLIKNDPAYNEQFPRPVVPYSAIHAVAEPARLPWLPNDGAASPELPEGTPFGLVGTSSLYKRDSRPGTAIYYGPEPDPYDGLDVFNTSENDRSSNWVYQGADAGKYADSEIYAVRILAMEPTTHRSYGAHGDLGFRNFFSHANEKLRILGEVPVRKAPGVLDPDGNPDTSFLVKIPADTPFTFQTLDRDGLILNASQTWHQLRPGEIRNNCGGCHAHSQMPTAFEQTAAAQPGYQVLDLAHSTPLLSADAQGNPTVVERPERSVDVEYFRDIRPVLQRSCVACHSGAAPAAGLDLDDDANLRGGLPGTYKRLAWDPAAEFGIPPVIQNREWRQTNASRYVRMFQSRRSLLAWKVYGRRLDGWTNEQHPTEATPGDPNTLPGGPDQANLADLDYTGDPMPPPAAIARGLPALSEQEKRDFARWIDLGCPIDLASQDPGWGWFLDDLRPTLTMPAPRAGVQPEPLTRIRIGLFDAYSGEDLSSLSVKASFEVDGHAPGSELASAFRAVPGAEGVYEWALAHPISGLANAKLSVSLRDQRGNESRLDRSFSVGEPVPVPDLGGRGLGLALACVLLVAVPARKRYNGRDGEFRRFLR